MLLSYEWLCNVVAYEWVFQICCATYGIVVLCYMCLDTPIATVCLTDRNES